MTTSQNSKLTRTRKFMISGFLLSTIIFLFYSFSTVNKSQFSRRTHQNLHKSEKFYINTSKCRILAEDPFSDEVQEFFHTVAPIDCSKSKPLLSYIERNGQSVTLRINRTAFHFYSSAQISCKYRQIIRIDEDNIRFLRYLEISDSATLTLKEDSISVLCQDSSNNKLYENVHLILNPDKMTKGKTSNNQENVIFIGIDSVSRLNLIRSMPRTYNFITRHNFTPLDGYTKIGDNTYPNLAALFTGKHYTLLNSECNPKANYFDRCDLIWNDFKAAGYVTAYGEDAASIGTFVYNRMGFYKPPTDLYLRPYIIASENLDTLRPFGSLIYCSGPESSGERIMNSALDFVKLIPHPKFGFFWMNSFSHDNLNTVSSMDVKFAQFLKNLYSIASKNTILIFLSDHGFRFGKFRYTHTGWLEERQPFFFVHFPDSFKTTRIKEYQNFLVNTKRLTTPYDVFATLRDILKMANYDNKERNFSANCLSLFGEIHENRTCKDAAIQQHYCLCDGHSYVSVHTEIVQKTAKDLIDQINDVVKSFEDSSKCSKYFLSRVVLAGMSKPYKNDKRQEVKYCLLIVETTPRAVFEATIELPSNFSDNGNYTHFQLLGEISRLDEYADNSKCLKESTLKKYCYCDSFFTSIRVRLCKYFGYC